MAKHQPKPARRRPGKPDDGLVVQFAASVPDLGLSVGSADDELLARADQADRDPSKVDIGKLSHAERNARLFGWK